jgi:hypothetical protein
MESSLQEVKPRTEKVRKATNRSFIELILSEFPLKYLRVKHEILQE